MNDDDDGGFVFSDDARGMENKTYERERSVSRVIDDR